MLVFGINCYLWSVYFTSVDSGKASKYAYNNRGSMYELLTKKERAAIRIGFGKLLREKRHQLGISQEELAFRSGLHRTYVGSVEKGERNLSLKNIFFFAKSLECQPSDLLPC